MLNACITDPVVVPGGPPPPLCYRLPLECQHPLTVSQFEFVMLNACITDPVVVPEGLPPPAVPSPPPGVPAPPDGKSI